VFHSKRQSIVNHNLNKMTHMLMLDQLVIRAAPVISRPSTAPATTEASAEVARLREEVARLQDLLREQQAELERLKEARPERAKAPLAALSVEEMNAALQAALETGALGKAL